MSKTVRLDIRDLPRDPQHYQGQLRTEAIKMANYVRKYPQKADALVELLEFVKAHVEKNIALEAHVEEEVVPKTTKKVGK
jgi:hypothetical protein